MSLHADAQPLGERFFSKGTIVLAALAAIGAAVYIARMFIGLATVTNLSDAYPWGIWIAVDVAGGVALAAGGFTSAALVYIFGRHRYHPLVRPALLTAALGYTFVVIGLLADLGRWYNVWHPMLPSMWQGNSVLFEVGICVMIYLTVLYLEFMPVVCERLRDGVHLPGAARVFNSPLTVLIRMADKLLPSVMWVFIILGVVLSCLHQSSLGALMLIAPYKVHPLWYTPVLPAFFLLSAISVGLPMIIFESYLVARSFRLPPERHLWAGLTRIIPALLGTYGVAKLVDITVREAWPFVLEGSPQSFAFVAELIFGVFLPLGLFVIPSIGRRPKLTFLAASLVVFGVVLNRINVFLVAYKPVIEAQPYWPSIFEVLVTVGLVCALVLIYRAAVIWLPVIEAREKHPTGSTRAGPISTGVICTALVWAAASSTAALGGCHAPERAGSPTSESRPQSQSQSQPQPAGTAAIRVSAAAPEGAQAKPLVAAPAADEKAGRAASLCEQCHTCATPTPSMPCLIACPRHSLAKEQSPHAVKEAPEKMVLDRIANQYPGVVFDHKLHAGMSEMGGGCSMCHHYCPPGKIPPCRSCHLDAPTSTALDQPSLKGAYHRQCLGCHREWSHDVDCKLCHRTTPAAQPSLEKTEKSDKTDIVGKEHPKMAAPDKRVYVTPYEKAPVVTFHHKEHVQAYGQRCVSCHRKENCSTCHDATKSPATKRAMAEVHATCTGCHDADNCAKCHDKAEKAPFSHDATGWPLSRFHSSLACNACHPAGKPASKLKTECVSCHGTFAKLRHAVTGFTLDETHSELDCEQCHGNRKFDKKPTCNGCHDDGRTYKLRR